MHVMSLYCMYIIPTPSVAFMLMIHNQGTGTFLINGQLY